MNTLLILALGFMMGALLLFGSGRSYSAALGSQAGSMTLLATPRATRVETRFVWRLFGFGFALRLVLVVLVNALQLLQRYNLAPDAFFYDFKGQRIAERMSRGQWDGWSAWIDDGWVQFTGLAYYVVWPSPVVMQLLNITLSSLTPVLIFWTLREAYGDDRLARWTAILVTVFPSFVVWSLFGLKDAPGCFATALLVFALVRLRQRISPKPMVALAGSLLIFLVIREYLFFVGIFFSIIALAPLSAGKAGRSLRNLTLVLLVVGLATYAAGFGFLASERIATSYYFDLDYINQARAGFNTGSGAAYTTGEASGWSDDLGTNVRNAVQSFYLFFITLDLSEIGSTRQLMALPEVLLFVSLLPLLWRGFRATWQRYRERAFPLIVVGLGIMAVYGSATTNMGAMFRFRAQVLPIFLAWIILGALLKRRGWLYRVLSSWAR